MTPKSPSPVLRLIRRAFEDRRVRDLSDHELLTRFSGGQDGAAFDGLLRRHGPMVLEVCRNVLGNDADAEDAFQATFLVLAQKAGAIRKRASVGSWLHGVAYRTALKARVASAKRRKHESHGPTPAPAESRDDLTWREVRQALHAELHRTSECYRAPLVLCYLEGKTQDEAARLLGVSPVALKKRLERGRALLRARLVRRGLGPAALLAAAAWPVTPASACLPATLAASTVQAATGLVAGHAAAGLVSAQVAALTEGVLKAMFLTKLRMVTAVLLAFVAVPLAGGVAVHIHAASAQVVAAGSDQAGAAAANQNRVPPKEADAKDAQDVLSGIWTKTQPGQSGHARLNFERTLPGPVPVVGSKPVAISWTPPAEAAARGAPPGGGIIGAGGAGGGGGIAGPGMLGAPRGYGAWYHLKERNGQKIIVIHMRDQEDVEASYKLDGDTLTFDGGVVEVGRRGGRPAFLTVELKGEWKRVDVDLENKLRRAFPGLDVESFVIQVENRSHRLVLAANSITVQGGRVHLENCAIARIADDPAGAKPTIPTAIRCAYAAFTTDKPVRTVAELGTATITAVEFPDGVRLNLKDQ